MTRDPSIDGCFLFKKWITLRDSTYLVGFSATYTSLMFHLSRTHKAPIAYYLESFQRNHHSAEKETSTSFLHYLIVRYRYTKPQATYGYNVRSIHPSIHLCFPLDLIFDWTSMSGVHALLLLLLRLLRLLRGTNAHTSMLYSQATIGC